MSGTKPMGRGSKRSTGPPDVTRIDELTTYIQVTKSTLYKLAQEGMVPGQKVGKHGRFSKTMIDRWLEDPASKRPAPSRGERDSV